MVAGDAIHSFMKGAWSSHPKPINPPGTWQFSIYPSSPWWAKPIAWYVGVTLKSGRHFRVGARFDDVDGYVQWPSIATRKYAGGDSQDTSKK